VSTDAVTVQEVSKKFRLYHERNQSVKSAILRGRRSIHEDFWALEDVSFSVPEGSTFGLIGSNGSGKSTLLKCLARIYSPEKGSISYNGRIAALLEVGSGFHPELSGRENIFLNGSILGMSRKDVVKKFDEIVSFSGVEAFIDQPVKNYSSGMYVRLGFSVAIHVDPDILIVDEVLAVGDAEFQERCKQKFAEFRDEGRTVILVSHSMGMVQDMCDQVAWLDRGQLVAAGKAKPTIASYLRSVNLD
jgi:ABC-2 type transport system ATP-binding protein